MILKKTFGIQKWRSIGVRASNNKNPESENDNNPLRASKMKDLRHPAKSLYQNELNLEDEIIASEEDYQLVTGANRQLRRQILQNAQILYDTTGSHASLGVMRFCQVHYAASYGSRCDEYSSLYVTTLYVTLRFE